MKWQLPRLPGLRRRSRAPSLPHLPGLPLPPRPRFPRLGLPRSALSRVRWPSRRAHRRLAAAVALFVLLLLWATHRSEPPRATWPRAAVLAAIRFVESSDRDDVPDGDNGLAIGPYQIHEVYWRDANASDTSLGGTYQDCRRRAYAERVVAAYMAKWCKDAWLAGDAEVIARVHNGGPGGADRASTLGYWERVRARLP